MAAEASRLTPGVRATRLAICGAASAMKPMGPAVAVTIAVVATPTTISRIRATPTLVPWVTAASSPSSMLRSAGASRMQPTAMAAAKAAAGTSEAQVTRAIEPAPQKPIIIASLNSAREMR
jgi:hypothetical protein